MAHSKLYIKLLNSKQWKTLRARYLTAHPQCERCKAEGYIKAAQAVHHIIPVETGRDEDECKKLCYGWNNLQALCYRCHSEIHKSELYSYSPKVHKQRESERFEQWKAKLNAMGREDVKKDDEHGSG